jgi:hypothetical protein
VSSSLHPLFGRVLSASGFKRWNGQLLLIVVLPDGSMGTLAAECTDVFGAAVDEPSSTSVLTVDGVRRLRLLLDAFDHVGGSRKRVRGQK